MHDLTAFQRDLLYVIAGMEMPYGIAIKEEVETYYSKPIQYGRLYPNLDSLAEKGLIEKGKIDERTNSYTVTRRGLREVEDRRSWEDRYLEGKQIQVSSA